MGRDSGGYPPHVSAAAKSSDHRHLGVVLVDVIHVNGPVVLSGVDELRSDNLCRSIRLAGDAAGGTTLGRTGDRQNHRDPKRTSEPRGHTLHGGDAIEVRVVIEDACGSL